MVQTSQLETRPILSVPYIPLPYRPTKILYPGSFQSPTEMFPPPTSLPFPSQSSNGTKLRDLLGCRNPRLERFTLLRAAWDPHSSEAEARGPGNTGPDPEKCPPLPEERLM